MQAVRKALCDLHLLISVCLIAFAVAFMLTPDVSVIAWIRDYVGIPLWFIVTVFLICALVILILRPPPRWLAVLAAPVFIFAICVMIWAITTRGSASGVVVYTMVVWLMYRSIYRLIDS